MMTNNADVDLRLDQKNRVIMVIVKTRDPIEPTLRMHLPLETARRFAHELPPMIDALEQLFYQDEP